jgi:hypothetical protein
MVTSTPSENLSLHLYEYQSTNFNFDTLKTLILHARSIFFKGGHPTKIRRKKIFFMKTLSKLGALTVPPPVPPFLGGGVTPLAPAAFYSWLWLRTNVKRQHLCSFSFIFYFMFLLLLGGKRRVTERKSYERVHVKMIVKIIDTSLQSIFHLCIPKRIKLRIIN